MSTKKCNPEEFIVDKKCTPQVMDVPPIPSIPFTVCHGPDQLVWDGSALSLIKGVAIPDGTYTSVTLKNNCIVGAQQAPIPIYTPPPCVEPPATCTPTGGGGVTPIAPDAGNQLMMLPSGLYSKCYVQAGANITVTGSGVSTNPYVISTSASSSTSVQSGNPAINVSTVAGVYTVGLNPSGVVPGSYAGFTVNTYGLITAYTPQDDPNITSIVGGLGVEVDITAGIATVSLPASPVAGEIAQFGAYQVIFSDVGTPTQITQTITVTAGQFTDSVTGDILYYNEFGSIYNRVPKP